MRPTKKQQRNVRRPNARINKPRLNTPIEQLEQRRMLNSAVHVTIDTTKTLQTMEGFGAGIIPWQLRPEYQDPNFFNLIVDDLGATVARAAVLPNAEKTNDNADPNNLDLSKFDVNALAEPFDIFQQLQARGMTKFITSVWSAPAWMKTNAIYTDGGALRPDMYTEFAEYLEGVTKIAKQNFGVDLYSISLQNEPFFVEPYESTTYSPIQLRETLRAVGRKFQADGITTKISLPEDLIDTGRMTAYVNAVMADPETAGYVGYFAGHALTGGWDALHSLLAPYNKEFWQTETSGNSATWGGAMGLANTIMNSVETADASGFLYWQFSDSAANSKFALMSDGVPNAKYYAAKQFYRYIRPGYVHVTDTADDSTIRTSSYKDPVTGAMTTVIVNTSLTTDADVSFALTGSNLPGSYKVFRSSSTENMVSLGSIAGGSTFSETIPANSIVTITNAPELPTLTGGGALAANTPIEVTSSFVQQNQFWIDDEKGYSGLQADINAGANVNQTATAGWTPLMTAAASTQAGSMNSVTTLLANGANINATNNDGWTALTAAAAGSFNKFGSVATLQNDKLAALLDAGSDINHLDNTGKTPLMWAAWVGKISGTGEDPSAVQYLLSRGANPNLKDSAGKTALDYANQMGFPKIAAVLNAAINGDTTKPVAHIFQVFPDPRTVGVDSFTISFTEPVQGFDLADLVLTDNGVTVPLTGANLSSSDGITYTLSNTTSLTSATGAYTLTLKSAGSGITDLSSNPLAANATDSWTTTVPNSPPPPPPPPSTQAPFHGSPFDITTNGTTTIEFEDYDNGGEGVAYHDVDTANLGGVYRTDGVDIQATTDTGGGFNVGYAKAGEWLEYTINVDTAGTYNLNFRLASTGTSGKFHAEIDGTNITGALTVPNTGGFQTWQTLTKSAVPLAAGQHVLRIAMDAISGTGSVGNFNYMTITPPNSPPPPPPPPPPPSTQQPFHGTPFDITANGTTTIQAEDFDTGGEGIAYHDLEKANQGGQYRTTEGVDIQTSTDTGGGFNVGYAKAGEWLEYTINVDTAGTYNLNFRLASTGSNGTFHAEIDGTNVTGALTVPNTGGYQTYQTLTKTGVSLSAGQHVLRIALDANSTNGSVGNFNYFTITPPNSPPPPPPPPTQLPFKGTPFAIGASAVTIQAEDFDTGGEGIAYHDLEKANQGGQYRTTEGVDIQTSTDTGGGFNIGYAKAGEWLEYTVNVATAGNYDFAFRLASIGSNGKFHAEIDGTNVTGSLTVPNTGGFQTYQTLTKTGIPLSAGQHVLRIAMDANSTNGSVGNFNYVTVTPSTVVPAQTPFLGSPFAIGSTATTIQAEDFDNGGEGIAYHDTDTTNQGGSSYRSNVGVDIELTGDTGGGNDVGFTKAGEWLEYTINVAATGTYTLDFRASSKGAGGNFHAEVDGTNVTGTLAVPNTTAWSTFTDINKTGVALTAGQHILRLSLDSVGGTGFTGDFNWIKLTKTA